MKAKNHLREKKGQLGAFGQIAVGVAVLAISLTIAFLVMATGKDQMDVSGFCDTADGAGDDAWAFNRTSYTCYNTSALGQAESSTIDFSIEWNSTSTLQDAAQEVPGWVPLIIIAFIGSVLLGLVALFRRDQ